MGIFIVVMLIAFVWVVCTGYKIFFSSEIRNHVDAAKLVRDMYTKRLEEMQQKHKEI